MGDKNFLFSIPLHRMISAHWQDMRSLLMDCVSVRYQTVPVLVWSWPASVVYHFKLFQIETINREYCFLPKGQVWWAKKFLLQAMAPSWRLPLSRHGGGGGREKLHNLWISWVVLSSFGFGLAFLTLSGPCKKCAGLWLLFMWLPNVWNFLSEGERF